MDDILASFDPCHPSNVRPETPQAPRRAPPRVIGGTPPWRTHGPPFTQATDRHFVFKGQTYNLDMWNTNSYEGVDLEQLPTEELEKIVYLSVAKLKLYDQDTTMLSGRSPVSRALPGTPLTMEQFQAVPQKIRDRYSVYAGDGDQVQTLPWAAPRPDWYQTPPRPEGYMSPPIECVPQPWAFQRNNIMDIMTARSPRSGPSTPESFQYSSAASGGLSAPESFHYSPSVSSASTGASSDYYLSQMFGSPGGSDADSSCYDLDALFASPVAAAAPPSRIPRGPASRAGIPRPGAGRSGIPRPGAGRSGIPRAGAGRSMIPRAGPNALRAPPVQPECNFINIRPPSPVEALPSPPLPAPRRALHQLPAHRMSLPHQPMADAQRRHGATLRSSLYSGPARSQLPAAAGASNIPTYAPRRGISSPSGSRTPQSPSPCRDASSRLTAIPAHKMRAAPMSMASAQAAASGGLRSGVHRPASPLASPTGASQISSYRPQRRLSAGVPCIPTPASPSPGRRTTLTALPAHKLRAAPESMASAQASAGRGLRSGLYSPASSLPAPSGPSTISSYRPQMRLSSGTARSPCADAPSSSGSRLTQLPAHRRADPFSSMASASARLSSGLRSNIRTGPQRSSLGPPSGSSPGRPRGTRAHPYPASPGSPLATPLGDFDEC